MTADNWQQYADDVAVWLGVAAAVGSALNASHQYSSGRKRRHIERVGATVNAIHSSSDDFEALSVDVRNAGDSPVYDVHMNLGFSAVWDWPGDVGISVDLGMTDPVRPRDLTVYAVGQELLTINELGPQDSAEFKLTVDRKRSAARSSSVPAQGGARQRRSLALPRDVDARTWALNPVPSPSRWTGFGFGDNRLAVVRISWTDKTTGERNSLPDDRGRPIAHIEQKAGKLLEALAMTPSPFPDAEYRLGVATGAELGKELATRLRFASTPRQLGRQHRRQGQNVSRDFLAPLDFDPDRLRYPDGVGGVVSAMTLTDVRGVKWDDQPRERGFPRESKSFRLPGLSR